MICQYYSYITFVIRSVIFFVMILMSKRIFPRGVQFCIQNITERKYAEVKRDLLVFVENFPDFSGKFFHAKWFLNKGSAAFFHYFLRLITSDISAG